MSRLNIRNNIQSDCTVLTEPRRIAGAEEGQRVGLGRREVHPADGCPSGSRPSSPTRLTCGSTLAVALRLPAVRGLLRSHETAPAMRRGSVGRAARSSSEWRHRQRAPTFACIQTDIMSSATCLEILACGTLMLSGPAGQFLTLLALGQLLECRAPRCTLVTPKRAPFCQSSPLSFRSM